MFAVLLYERTYITGSTLAHSTILCSHTQVFPTCALNSSVLIHSSIPHSHTYVLLYSLLVHVTIPYWYTTQLVMIIFKLTAPTHTLGYSLLTLNNSHSHTQLFAFPTHTLNHSSLTHSCISYTCDTAIPFCHTTWYLL